jgi:hypothetical protein
MRASAASASPIGMGAGPHAAAKTARAIEAAAQRLIIAPP